MKTIAILTIAILTVSIAAAQSFSLTPEVNNSGKANVAVLVTEGNTFGFAQYCEGGWWQAYAGLSHSGTVGDVAFQAALGLGAEQYGSRIGGWAWMGEGNFSFIHLFEDGGSGPWHRSILKAQVSDELALGLTDRSYYGRGLRAEYKLGRTSTIIGEVFEGGSSTLALSTCF